MRAAPPFLKSPSKRPIRSAPAAVLGTLLVAALGVPAPGQTPDCDDAAPFVADNVLDRARHRLEEPLKMDFDMDAQGRVDIYFVERMGRLRRFDASTQSVTELGRLQVHAQGDHGLTGIALDPAFKENRRLYLAYSSVGGSQRAFTVARYSLGADGLLDMASVRVLLSIPTTQPYHTLSTLRFDADGNLFVAVGENFAGEAGASNPGDLRGKILRIRPREDGSYDVPEGNLFPPGLEGTRPEIYVMGVRNPYSLAYDPGEKRLAWGEFGPDRGKLTEEFNAATRPGNFGWPHFAGNQIPQSDNRVVDPAAPVNQTPASNGGLRHLPPALPPIHSYRQSGSLTGPLYRYKAGRHPFKLPPSFDGAWFVTDFSIGWVATIRLDAAGTGMLDMKTLPGIRLRGPVDFQEGPDGVLYVINYAGYYSSTAETSIARLVYRGCDAVSIREEGFRAGLPAESELRGSILRVTGGTHTLRLRDGAGRLVREIRGQGPVVHDLARIASGRPGIYLAEVETAGNRQVRRVALAAP